MIVEEEYALRACVTACLRDLRGIYADVISRILTDHVRRIAANIIMFNEGWLAFSSPPRSELPARGHSPAAASHTATASDTLTLLPALLARHLTIIQDIDTLLLRGNSGVAARLALTGIVQNHEQMAFTLMAVLEDDAFSHAHQATRSV